MPEKKPTTLTCPPRFGTPRNHDRLTLGPQVGEMAKRLGMTLMPWQQHVVDVALEIDEDDGGLFYPELDLIAPRQQGKTAIVLSKLVHRAKATKFFGGPQNILYTAQDRNFARKKWLEDHVKRLRASRRYKEGRDYEVRLSNGSEAILWTNGSSHGICAPTDTAAHGETLDEGVIDEGFAHEDDAVEQGMSPAMITRRNSQFFVLSAAGTKKSKYLYRKIVTGRAAVQRGGGKVAYFEWSAPDGSDPADPAVWRGCNPALGFTITEASLRSEYLRLAERGQEGIDLWCRAHLAMWPEVPILDDRFGASVIDLVLWARREDTQSDMTGSIVFAYDVTPDRSKATIGAAGQRPDGRTHVEVIETREGTTWLPERLAELKARWGPIAVVCAAGSPAVASKKKIEAAGVEVTIASAQDFANACGAFFEGVTEGTVFHGIEPELDAALAGAAVKPVGDAWVWSRSLSSSNVSPLIAVTLATWPSPAKTSKPVFAY